MAFEGVPNETRKAFVNGTTTFERVLPGPDRMYPDTDSAPIPISEKLIERIKTGLPEPVDVRMKQLRDWKVPDDAHAFILKSNLVPLLEELIESVGLDPGFAGTLLGHTYKHISGKDHSLSTDQLDGFVATVKELLARKMHYNILTELLPMWLGDRSLSLDTLLRKVGYENTTAAAVTGQIEKLNPEFKRNKRTHDPNARAHWIMGRVRRLALGNMPLSRMWRTVKEVVGDE
jgi:glutamyl-tRNA(Gln) amidotransferase subunit E